MRIALIYPPTRKDGLYPLLSQNRQFKYARSLEVRIYPVVMASLATMLSRDGHDVLYLDGVNERLGLPEFFDRVSAFRPDLAVLETKAPLLREHWRVAESLKQRGVPRIAFVGDHVSSFPEETIEAAPVDFVVRGGDYDFTTAALARSLAGRGEMPPGVTHRAGNTGNPVLYDLGELPRIDRELTRFRIYGEAYLHQPCAYVLSGRGCGGTGAVAGQCTFCVWQYNYWRCTKRLRPVGDFLDEVEELVRRYGVREVFDDNESGFLWDRDYTGAFLSGLKERGLVGRLRISSNARADSLDAAYCRALRTGGFRLLKVGVESGNDATLERLKKLETITRIEEGIAAAKSAGLVVLITTMVGYPWETEEDARRTYATARRIMLRHAHFGDSLQSSVIVPYPGTPLYREALENRWFAIDPKDYHLFDMSRPVLKTTIDTTKWCRRMWRIHLHPWFLLRSLLTLRSPADVRLAARGVRSLFGHLSDYGKES